MKSIILAAGLGERLRPLTESKPKCLVEFNGKTFLKKQIEILECLEIRDIAIVTGYQAEKIRQATGDRLKYIHNAGFEHNGTLDSLALAKEIFDDGVILINSDALFTRANLEALIASPEDICLGVDTSARGKSSTSVRIEGGKIVDMGFLEPQNVSGIYCGFSKFSKKAACAVRDILRNVKADKESYVFHLIRRLLERGETIGYVECERNSWCEIDTHEDLKNKMAVINELLR